MALDSLPKLRLQSERSAQFQFKVPSRQQPKLWNNSAFAPLPQYRKSSAEMGQCFALSTQPSFFLAVRVTVFAFETGRTGAKERVGEEEGFEREGRGLKRNLDERETSTSSSSSSTLLSFPFPSFFLFLSCSPSKGLHSYVRTTSRKHAPPPPRP